MPPGTCSIPSSTLLWYVAENLHSGIYSLVLDTSLSDLTAHQPLHAWAVLLRRVNFHIDNFIMLEHGGPAKRHVVENNILLCIGNVFLQNNLKKKCTARDELSQENSFATTLTGWTKIDS